MAKYRVRDHFCVTLGDSKYPQGFEIDLTDEQFKLVAHQVEPIANSPKKKEAE